MLWEKAPLCGEKLPSRSVAAVCVQECRASVRGASIYLLALVASAREREMPADYLFAESRKATVTAVAQLFRSI